MDALELRKAIKSKKPKFRRQDAHKISRISRTGYRRPRGIQSKMRLGIRGYARKTAVGFGSPLSVKFFDPSGLKPFIVNNLADLVKLDVKTEGAIISSTVGLKKKLTIVKKAEELKITIINVKDTKSFVENQEKIIADKKKVKESKKKTRDTKKQQKEKSATKEDKKESEETVTAAEDKKAEEKHEKDKVLTQAN